MWFARCRCRWIAELARDLEDAQASQPAGHAPFDFITLAITEQRGAEWREHRDAPCCDVGLGWQYERVILLVAGREIAHAHARLHRDDVRRHFVCEAHDRALEFSLEFVQVSLVVCRVITGTEQRAQPIGVRFTHEDRVLSHVQLQRIESLFS